MGTAKANESVTITAQESELVSEVFFDDGDLVSYYFEAYDNAQPKAKVAKTELRFIEIRPVKPDAAEAESAQNQGKDQGTKLSVANLIQEQKYLLRQTFKLDTIDDLEIRKEQLDMLAKSQGDLHNKSKEMFDKIRAEAKAQMEGQKQELLDKEKDLGVYEKLFDDTTRDMSAALGFLEKEMAEEAVKYQRATLSSLVKIEIELNKNRQKSKSKDQEPQEPQDSDGDDSEPEEPDEEMQRKMQEKLKKLQKSMNEVKDLARRQDRLNKALEREKGQQTSPEERKRLADEQAKINKDTDALKKELREAAPDARQAIEELDKASQKMMQSRSKIKQDQMTNAQNDGEKARQFLERSKELLDQFDK